MKKKIDILVNNQEVLDTLIYLKERWADERGFEDFKDYGDAMKKEAEKAVGKLANFKATKRPFGFQANLGEEGTWQLFTKRKSYYTVLCAQRIAA